MNQPPAPQSHPRVVPANMDIEACVLGTLLLDPSLFANLPPMEPRDFYWEHHQHLWRLMLDLQHAGRQPSEAMVRDEIEARGWADRTLGRDEFGNMVSGAAYLATLVKMAYEPELENSAVKLLELSRCRQGIDLCYRTAKRLETGDLRAEHVMEGAAEDMRAIAQAGYTEDTSEELSDLAMEHAEAMLSPAGVELPHYPLGFDFVNEALHGGLQPEDFMLLAARTGTGKTKVALYMLASIVAAGTKVGLLSLDMGRPRLMPYIIPAFANVLSAAAVTGRQIHDPRRDGDVGEARLLEAAAAVDPGRLCRIISQPRSYSLSAVSGYVRHLARQGCKVILIDQLQDIAEWQDGASDRGVYQRIIHELRIELARRYGLALIVLHQINRMGADFPTIRDLKDSGCTEEMADFIILLHDYQNVLIATEKGYVLNGDRARAPKAGEMAQTRAQGRRLVSLHLAKSRSSAVERVDVWFDYSLGVAG